MFRIFGILCVINGLSNQVECTTHYRDDFKTWPTHELCMPHAEAALEETLDSFKQLNTQYTSVQVGCEEVTQEQLDIEKKQFEAENDDTI